MKAEFPEELIAPASVIVAEAHTNNYGYGVENMPMALVLHTPEEDKDDNEVTPRWFQNPDAGASTHYYADDDGDLYQMVPEREGAYAQGVTDSQRHWKGDVGAYAPWAQGVNNNLRALSIEIEGRAHNFEWTPQQFYTVAAWIAYKAKQYSIPIDREHIVGHEELALHKSDPGIALGTFDIEELLAEARGVELESDEGAMKHELLTAQAAIKRALELLP
jgi:N-acetyl-anhydromuramyl-L-alanine amidase AmpD